MASVTSSTRALPFVRAIRRLGPAAGRPAQPRAVGGDRRRDEAQLHAAAGRRERQLGPHVELREHQGRRPQRLQGGGDVPGAVERQIIRDIRGEALREALGRGREEGVGELPPRLLRTQRLEDGLCLQPFAHRRRVHPHERPLRIALCPSPGGESLRDAPPAFDPARDLLVEPRGDGKRPLAETNAEPVEQGRTVRHQRGRDAVLLR